MSGDPSFQVHEVAHGRRHRLVLVGELDIAPVADLETRVLRLCAEGASSIVIVLSRLTFMGSTGIRMILAAREACAERGCEFFVIPGPPSVQRLFEITGLLDQLPFRAHLDGDEAADPDTLELA